MSNFKPNIFYEYDDDMSIDEKLNEIYKYVYSNDGFVRLVHMQIENKTRTMFIVSIILSIISLTVSIILSLNR